MSDTTDIKHPTTLTFGTPADFTEAGEPFALFGAWFAEACKAEPNDPNAMALASVDADGLPDVRMVLMKGYDAEGFVFYSHIASQKGRELSAPGPASNLKPSKAASPSNRRSPRLPPDTSSARCRARRAGAAGASRPPGSSSGTTVRSACTTVSNFAATRRTRFGPRRGSIPDVERFEGTACPAPPTRRDARCSSPEPAAALGTPP